MEMLSEFGENNATFTATELHAAMLAAGYSHSRNAVYLCL